MSPQGYPRTPEYIDGRQYKGSRELKGSYNSIIFKQKIGGGGGGGGGGEIII
jgi:hypothetical protein